MSNFSKMTVHPETKKLEMADWMDDYFGRHHYGVKFADGKIFDAEVIGDSDYRPPTSKQSKKAAAMGKFVESLINNEDTPAKKRKPVPQPQVMLPSEVYPIFDILPRLWSAGYTTCEQDGRWHLFRKDGEGVVSGVTFRDLCVNIVLCGIDGEVTTETRTEDQ